MEWGNLPLHRNEESVNAFFPLRPLYVQTGSTQNRGRETGFAQIAGLAAQELQAYRRRNRMEYMDPFPVGTRGGRRVFFLNYFCQWSKDLSFTL